MAYTVICQSLPESVSLYNSITTHGLCDIREAVVLKRVLILIYYNSKILSAYFYLVYLQHIMRFHTEQYILWVFLHIQLSMEDIGKHVCIISLHCFIFHFRYLY